MQFSCKKLALFLNTCPAVPAWDPGLVLSFPVSKALAVRPCEQSLRYLLLVMHKQSSLNTFFPGHLSDYVCSKKQANIHFLFPASLQLNIYHICGMYSSFFDVILLCCLEALVIATSEKGGP